MPGAPAKGDRPVTDRVTAGEPMATAPSPELARILERAAVDGCPERVEAAFIGSGACVRRDMRLSDLQAGILWDVLPGFLESAGFTIHGEVWFNEERNEPGSPRLATVELGPGEALDVPKGLLVCVEHRDGRRVAIAFFEPRYSSSSHVDVGVHGVGETGDVWCAWQAWLRAHHRLRGRSILPTGKIVTPSRKVGWDDLYLPEGLKAEVRFQVEFALRNGDRLGEMGVRRRRGLILHGVPGTGKTLIGKILAQTVGTTFIWATPRDLEGADGVRGVFDLARTLAPAVVFVEDIDILAEDRQSSPRSLALGELMNQVDGYAGDHAVVTVATTNRLDVVEEACRNRPARFDRMIEIPPPDAASARVMLEQRLAGHRVDPAALARLASDAAGATGAELEEIANTAIMLALEAAGVADPAGLAITPEHLAAALEAVPRRAKGAAGFA